MADKWDRKKADTVRAAFYEYLKHVSVKSKEEGWIILGDHLYGGQVKVIEAIFDGLAEDKHDFKILKSRQLGISTIIRALMLFWMGAFEVTGALVFDTSQHLDEARVELIEMLGRMPSTFKFPRAERDNRYSLTLDNRSRVNLLSVGAKESKGGRGLGAGSAVSMTHRSELCSYGNISGLESFRHSLARRNPNRLFIDESTARGFNIWYEIWNEAKDDPDCVCIFCGWWSHPGQFIDRDDPKFDIYGIDPPTDDERKKIDAVWRQYKHRITPEQLAWIRREMNPAVGSDDAPQDRSGDPARIQEQPWTEQEAFQQTGSVFFNPEGLTDQSVKNVSRKFKSYSYTAGIEFTDLRIYPAPNTKTIQLKVWEEPVEESVYVVSADPAFGHSEESDRSSVQVLRCFSDGVDQVAEYAWPLIDSRQFAWVIASLEGWYAGEKSEVYRIIELNGPGAAVFQELKSLKHQLVRGYFGAAGESQGLVSIQRNVRNYLYTRVDSMAPGNVMQFKTQQQLKVEILERLRDFTNSGLLRIKSSELIEEMRTVSREGDRIGSRGLAKDDRVMAMAMAVRCWEERARRGLVSARRTRASEETRRSLTIRDQVCMFNQNQFDAFLTGKSVARRRAITQARRKVWRG